MHICVVYDIHSAIKEEINSLFPKLLWCHLLSKCRIQHDIILLPVMYDCKTYMEDYELQVQGAKEYIQTCLN